jgi:putative membrane protein
MKKIKFLIVIASAAVAIQACSGKKASAATDSTITTTDSTKTSTKIDSTTNVITDTTFVTKAAISGMAEVALGKMAVAKGTNPQIKDFGKMMITDHSKANAELASIAKSKNIAVPTVLDAEHQAKSDSLSKLSGKDFDAAYVKVMIEGHQKTLALMQSETSNGKDANLKAFAAKTAPIVQMHLSAITKIQGSLK